VTVVSRKRDATQAFRWQSDGKSGFSTEPAERAGRGTAVMLHLKEDQREFLKPYRIRELVKRYSDYVGHPIELRNEPKQGEAESFERINQASALWQRKPGEISDQQYEEFYKHLSHDFEAPVARRHFRVEGTQEFTGLLFVPTRPPFDMFSTEERHGVRLHVKRVFIMDDCKELLPRWLRFVRGVVDSEDLPLNVSREILQDSKLVRVMKKQVVKHALDMLDEIAEKRPDDYKQVWKNYGAVLKEGVHFDPEYKERLEKLYRFDSSKVDGLTSLADYVSRMQEGQTDIYYILGPSRRTVEASPHLESLKARGFEVLYMVDPVDEWAVRALSTFNDKPLRSAMDEKLDLKRDEQSADAPTPPSEGEDALLKRFQEVLKEQVSQVRVSERLTDSPSCLVIPDGGLGPYIERLLRAQQGGDIPAQKRILEVNTKHPLIQALVRLLGTSSEDASLSESIELIYDQALLAEGSPIDDPARMAKRLIKLLQNSTEAQLASSAG
jgi:molecular chaperone HtpG